MASDVTRASIRFPDGEEIDVTDALNRAGANADLRSFYDRAVALEEERRQAAEAVKDLMTEVKAAGFDTKAMRALLKRHFETAPQRATREASEMSLHLMAKALGEFASTPLGGAAMARAGG